MTPLVWSRQAEDDLAAIRTYIARDSEHYAQDTVDRLLSAVDRLLLWPRSGRVVPEVTRIYGSFWSVPIASFIDFTETGSASSR